MIHSNGDNPKQVLYQLRAELEADLQAIKPARVNGNLAAETADVLVEQIKHDLHRVDAAIARIDTGLYGYCIGCGEEIENNHLRADPAVDLCVSCSGKVKRLTGRG
ncbi:TraR/DksA family transcriptional regulator [Marinobacterium sp. YM272]|uniref:TraR/DksA family transcriptional regulator n=1 Tax=Marinobacterium sp. YM272 TaxID=3421654 RepID=UPI003D7F8B94